MKFFFMPGTFILDNVVYESGCIRISFISIFTVIYATYEVLPYAFSFIIISIVIHFIIIVTTCVDRKSDALCFFKFLSLFGLTCVLLVSNFLWWLSFFGDVFSWINSTLLLVIVILSSIDDYLLKLIK
jgi:hypothetical protein